MLLDIDTGYEGKFDFPRRAAPPELVYMLASIPRTGSTYVSHLLWRTGCLGAPLEYLNFEPSGPYFFAARSAENQTRLWRSLLHRRTSPNGVFGIKVFPVQLQALQQGNPTLLAELRPTRIVYLDRRDRIAHIVSYARATMTGVWRKEQEKDLKARPAYSREALEMAERGIEFQAAGWERMFRERGIEPLRLWYEDVVARPEDATRQVTDYLGVTLVPGAEVAVPPVLKQSAAGSEDWGLRYERSKDAGAR
ncbi:MAG TPA: Stf0 family sulfotransferase [Allosphingosinicella sp.]|jgi:LPS sulfotransferase NodH|nr:Stf0 family sulfotransferase [Allosphingosinicella sp.]